jgi:hypothetical protein
VALDRLDAYEEELGQLAAFEPPRCLERNAGSDAAERANRRCGELLREVIGARTMRASLGRSTERHELQHQLDGASLPCSGWVLRRLSRMGRDAQLLVNRELSAHLAQMAATGAPARLTLLRLYRFLLLGRRVPEYHVAWLALEAMSQGPHCEATDAGCLAELFLSLAARDDEALEARARTAWRELYGAELAEVEPLE